MTTEPTLPHLETCLELYRTAYDQHGSKLFSPEQLNWESPELSTSRLLEFGVAYGLLSRDGESYRLHCPPNATEQRWEQTLSEHATTTKQAVLDRLDPAKTASEATPLSSLTHDGEEYASVFVNQSDGFDAVADAIATVNTDEWAGVVLRSAGDHSSTVQRFADRLCDPSEPAKHTVSPSFHKVTSDVSGTEKNALEFRLYLTTD